MKHSEFIMPLFTPDIMQYITGREVVCELVLSNCKKKLDVASPTVTLKTLVYTELNFTNGDIIEVLLATGAELHIKMSYKLFLKLHDDITIEELATLVWKHMCRVVKNN